MYLKSVMEQINKSCEKYSQGELTASEAIIEIYLLIAKITIDDLCNN